MLGEMSLKTMENNYGKLVIAAVVIGLIITSVAVIFAAKGSTFGVQDPGSVSRVTVSCTVPYDDMYISSNTTLCPGSYTIPDTGNLGVIIISADNVVLDCNNAVITGGDSGRGIYNPGFKNVVIKNCEVKNYDDGIFLSYYSNDNQLISNTVTSCYGSGFYLQTSSGVILNNNTANSNYQGINLYNSSQNELNGNTANLNDYGFYLGGGTSSAGNTVEGNTACGNTISDFYVIGNIGSGDDNACTKPDGWNDKGITGCTYGCKPILPLSLSLHIEDALEGFPVNKIVGDVEGPAKYTLLEIVAKIISNSPAPKEGIPVVLTIPSDLFGAPVGVWVRDSTGGARTSIGYDNLGGGKYRVSTDLSRARLFTYRKQVVWRFLIPNDITPQTVVVNAEVQESCLDPKGTGTIRILAPGSVRSLIIVNRELLYENYADDQVSRLLQRLFIEAQGQPVSQSPSAVIYYVDQYDARVLDWDNDAVNYTSEATANVVANAIDDLIEDWQNDATKYLTLTRPFFKLPIAAPEYLLIVGDDDTIPFYRYNDPSNDEGINFKHGCTGWCVDSNAPPNVNPSVWATDNDYILTDNPYADLGTDWQTGDIELSVGRLLGETAADMLSLLEEGVRWENGDHGGIVMASVGGWELGLEPDDGRWGEIADLSNVPVLFRGRGFQVRNDDVPATEVRTIDVMSPYEGGDSNWNMNFRNAANNASGMDLFFIGGHNDYNHAVIPGDYFTPDDTPGNYTRFDDDHPIAIIVGCHGGIPVRDGGGLSGGVDNDMVYDLIHEGARAYIGATGFSYGSPNNLHICTWGERLLQSYFTQLLNPVGGKSMTIGKAMVEAKKNYVFGFGNNSDIDRKTVTEFNVYGVPWAFIFYPSGKVTTTSGASETPEAAFSTSRGAIMSNGAGVYSTTFEVFVDSYSISTETQNSIAYDLFSIDGGDIAVSDRVPLLPFIEVYRMTLPFGGAVTDVQIIDSNSTAIGTYNIPIAQVEPFSEGGLSYTTETDINYPYPPNGDLIQYQATSEGVLFTIFPIQHNPTTDETTYYNYFKINVTYASPLNLVVTEFSTDRAQYLPRQRIFMSARIENIGDVAAVVNGVMNITDALGQVVGTHETDAFSIPAGGSSVVPLEWDGSLNDGAYLVQLKLESLGATVGGASTRFSVLGGEITNLTVPGTLSLGEEGVFQVTFANYQDVPITGQVNLTIQNGEGGLVKALAPENFSLEDDASLTTDFRWTPLNVSTGNYAAIATVSADGQMYGPVSRTFMVYESTGAIFDTGESANPYPSIFGTHVGSLTPTQTLTISTLFAYPCDGTSGHVVSFELYEDGTRITSGTWDGYDGDWHNITLVPQVLLLQDQEYHYILKTGSYLQIYHTAALETPNGWINCTEFTDINGIVHEDWIPAIRLE